VELVVLAHHLLLQEHLYHMQEAAEEELMDQLQLELEAVAAAAQVIMLALVRLELQIVAAVEAAGAVVEQHMLAAMVDQAS
jgi:hypothetical protein